jgi:ethanolamine transporter EutH
LIVTGVFPNVFQPFAAVLEVLPEGLLVAGFVEFLTGSVIESGMDNIFEIVAKHRFIVEVFAARIGGLEAGQDAFAKRAPEGTI